MIMTDSEKSLLLQYLIGQQQSLDFDVLETRRNMDMCPVRSRVLAYEESLFRKCIFDKSAHDLCALLNL